MADNAENSSLANKKLTFLLSLPWMQIFTWGAFFLILYSVRSFFTVIFLTFIISYITCNVVDGVTGLLKRWEWFRKVIVLLTFAVFLFVTYSAVRYLGPNVVEQGRGVVNTITKFGLDRGPEQMAADAIAWLQFNRFNGSRDYRKELETERSKQDLNRLTFEDFRAYAAGLRADFRAQELAILGQQQLEKTKDSDEFREGYLHFREAQVIEKVYEPRKKELVEARERALLVTLGQREFEELKGRKGTAYDTYLRELILPELLDKLTEDDEKNYRQEFERRWSQERGAQALTAAEGSPEWQKGFAVFYEARKKDPPHDYTYDRFVELDKAPDHPSFVALWGGEELAKEQGEQALAKRFEKRKTDQFAADARKWLNEAGISKTINDAAGKVLPTLAGWLGDLVSYFFTITFHLILSVFFSFIIVMDIPRLRRGVELLAQSRIQSLFREIAPGLAGFGNLMGRAFQAQALIAMINTGLTLVALSILEVGNQTFLCIIVFICSFIPVVGVVISSVPIALVGLQAVGIALALKLIAAIVLIHLLESLVLNPKILGEMLHLHPLVVLVILTVGGHYFGVWGLLLGVPTCVYIIRHVILRGMDPAVLARLAPRTALAEGEEPLAEENGGEQEDEEAAAVEDEEKTAAPER